MPRHVSRVEFRYVEAVESSLVVSRPVMAVLSGSAPSCHIFSRHGSLVSSCFVQSWQSCRAQSGKLLFSQATAVKSRQSGRATSGRFVSSPGSLVMSHHASLGSVQSWQSRLVALFLVRLRPVSAVTSGRVTCRQVLSSRVWSGQGSLVTPRRVGFRFVPAVVFSCVGSCFVKAVTLRCAKSCLVRSRQFCHVTRVESRHVQAVVPSTVKVSPVKSRQSRLVAPRRVAPRFVTAVALGHVEVGLGEFSHGSRAVLCHVENSPVLSGQSCRAKTCQVTSRPS